MFMDLVNESVTFRATEAGGALTLWFRFGDSPEVGPIQLSCDESERLAEHIQAAVAVVQAGLRRGLAEQAPVTRTHTTLAEAPEPKPKLRLVR